MSAFPVAQLVGKSKGDAVREIKAANLHVRIRTQRDRSTGVFLFDRVTIYVESGKVVRAMIG